MDLTPSQQFVPTTITNDKDTMKPSSAPTDNHREDA
jgi:hypothetical protein